MRVVTHVMMTLLIVFLSTSLFAQKSNITDKNDRNSTHSPVGYSPTRADIISEGFEGTVFPPAGWTQVIQNAGYTWKGSTLLPYSGLKKCDIEYDVALVPQNEWIITPAFSLLNAGTATVSFYFNTSYYWHVSPNNNADIFLKISTDNGTTWTNVWKEEDQGVFENWIWYQVTKSLTPYVGHANVKLAWNYVGVDGAQFNLDEVVVNVPCEVGEAANPSPVNNATGVDITLPQLSWTNPANATVNKVYFGTDQGSLTLVHSGSLVSSYLFPPAPLAYNTKYYWRVNEANASCETPGPLWSFTTMQDPNSSVLFLHTFEDATFPPANWSLVIESGTSTQGWSRMTTASGYGIGSASSRFNFYSTSAGNIHSMISESFGPITLGFIKFDHAYAPYNETYNDKLDIDYSMDNGSTWTNLVSYSGMSANPLATAPVTTSTFVPTASQWGTKTINLPVGVNKLKFKAVSGFGNNLWLDNITVENVVPVELASFNADINGTSVILNWITSSELNNNGFEIERSYNGNSFEKIGFVNGNGSSALVNTYSFTDAQLPAGKYSYRLKQLDFDGTFEYSYAVEAEIVVPLVFALGQNYPNPFNPSTKIDFSLAVDSKVSLRVFDILGQEVSLLLDQNMNAGNHSINFNASKLMTGMYIYKLEAAGVDGNNFSDIKKMLLVK
jgi:hypothetical protein